MINNNCLLLSVYVRAPAYEFTYCTLLTLVYSSVQLGVCWAQSVHICRTVHNAEKYDVQVC